MALWRELVRRAAWLGRRSNFDGELNEEFEFHVEMRAGELQAEGLSREEAMCAARREFGPRARALEDTRSAWHFRWIEQLAADLRYAARAFRRNPSFSLTAIACLALGVGANTSMFSIAMEVLFSQPSCRQPESLLQVRLGGASYWPAREYQFLRDSGSFPGVAGMNIGEVVNWREAGGSHRLAGTRVTSNLFEVAGIPVALGRAIQSGESQAAVATYGFWNRQLGADPNAVGRKLVLDGQPYTLVGVLPREHRNLAGFGFTPDLYLTTDSSEYLVYVRLPDGLTRPAARDRMQALCQELDRVFPDPQRKRKREVMVSGVGGIERLRAEAGEGGIGGGVVAAVAFFGLLIAVTALVLLIACANVSSLLLTRAVARSREFAIRAALGGSRGRIVRQLLAESLLLAVCGTGAGLLVNVALTRIFSNLRLSFWLPIEFWVQPDRRLLVYSAALAVIVTIAAGLVPAIKGTRDGIAPPGMPPGGKHADRSWTPRNALVVAQLAVSIVLLSAGWIFVRNLLQASSLDAGFDTSRTVWATFRAIPELCTRDRFKVLTAAAVEGLQALPGVDSVALARAVPLQSPFRVTANFRPDAGGREVQAQYNYNEVGPDYFRTMRIPVVRGRPFLSADQAASMRVAIVNENLAQRLFGAASPLGRTVRINGKRDFTIVGVARNSKYFLVGEANPQALYVPWTQQTEPVRFAHFLVRAKQGPETVVREVEKTLAAIDPAAAVEVRTMRDAVQFTLLPSRVGAGVLGAMALLGLALASIGLYGVLLYTTTRRVREIGIRMALGATPRRVLGMVAAASGRLVGAGMAVGIGVSIFAVRPLAMFLVPGVRAADPMNFAVVACALAVVAACATVSPTVAALRVDPAAALRHE